MNDAVILAVGRKLGPAFLQLPKTLMIHFFFLVQNILKQHKDSLILKRLFSELPNDHFFQNITFNW